MAFQRSYSKVWWGSENQLPALTAPSSGLPGSRVYSFYGSGSGSRQQAAAQQQPSSFGGATALDGQHFRSYSGNLSRIQEVDDEHNASALSWEKHDSPGSLRSQDSGFSDNEESHSTRSRSSASAAAAAVAAACHASAPSSPGSKSQSSTQSFGSPTSASEGAATPPTVVRRVGRSEFYPQLVNASRRISFGGALASPQTMSKDKQLQSGDEHEEEEGESSSLMEKLDSMQLVEGDPAHEHLNFESPATEACKCSKQRRRRRVARKPTRPLSPTNKRVAAVDVDIHSSRSSSSCNSSDSEATDDKQRSSSLKDLEVALKSQEASEISAAQQSPSPPLLPPPPPYNNETVYLGEAPPPYNNETVVLGGGVAANTNANDGGDTQHYAVSPLKVEQQHRLGSTSTPKRGNRHAVTMFPLDGHEYPHPLLNGHQPALQSWLSELRLSHEQEVMSTLQTKSIAAEAFKSLTITTNTVAKLIRQLQQRAQHVQLAFERLERMLSGEQQAASLAAAFGGAEQLVAEVAEFSRVLERRAVFFTDSRADRRRYEQSIEQINLLAKDTRISLERQHYIHLESLLEDLLVLKRCLLVALRLVFEKLVRVILQSIEHGRCDLMLRANINMIATLTNDDCEGFASLTDAFVRNEAVRTLLLVCLEHRVSAVRALVLRALATVCCAPATIAQLAACGGMEVLRDILHVDGMARGGDCDARECTGDLERREAVSLLTQITAVWHGPEHRLDGLRDAAETIITGLTALMARSGCAQTLLLCAAAMNNLSRMEVTSHYSIMSNEAIFKWIEAVQRHPEEVSIFLYEQLAAMLHNMSLNKKCHSHLCNGCIVNFITSIYQQEFHRVYESRAERDSQRRTIKAMLHTLTRLVHESSLGAELLELQGVPEFLKTTLLCTSASGETSTRQPHGCTQTTAGVAGELVRQANEKRVVAVPAPNSENTGGSKLNQTRQESYV